MDDGDLEAAWADVRRAGLALRGWDAAAVDPQPVARALSVSAQRIFDAMDARGDALAAVRDAGAALEEVLAWAGGRSALDPAAADMLERVTLARRKLTTAEHRLASERPAPPTAPPLLMASGDEPRLHQLMRRPIPVVFDAPPSPPAEVAVVREPPRTPESFEELHATIAALRAPRAATPAPLAGNALSGPSTNAAALPPGFADDTPRVAVGQIAFLEARCREMFEEVSMVALQRTPMPGEPWRESLLLERRMLAAIDAIAAIGPIAVEHVGRLWMDAPLRDGHHAFALAACLGAIAGRDALAGIEVALFAADRSDEVAEGLVAALRFAPHDRLAGALASWLREEDPVVRAVAIEVLIGRGLATPQQLVTAADDEDARVAGPALIRLACAGAAHPDLAALVERARHADAPRLVHAGHVAATVALLPFAASALGEQVRESGDPDLTRWLAIAGDEADAAWLLEQAMVAAEPAAVDAVGWAGSGAAVAPLIGLLGTEDDALDAVVASALDRITGAGLLVEVAIDDDALDVSIPPDPPIAGDRRPRLARVVSDPRDLPPEPEAETMLAPSRDPDAWARWLEERGGALDLRSRLRRGAPYAPTVVLGELDHGRVTPEERAELQGELVLRSGRHVALDPRDLVAAQLRAIEAWGPHARATSSAPGRWTMPTRRQ